MKAKALLVQVEEHTVEVLRAMAQARGLVCKRGPGAPLQRGNISALLNELAKEYIRGSRTR